MTELSPAATAAATGTTGFKAPGTTPTKTPRGFSASLAGVNFGVYLAVLTPIMISMAFKVQHISASPGEATAALGMILGVGALFALFANPLAGRLSDRTTSRWGMRRPWIFWGSLAALAGLVLIGVTTSVWIVLIAWCLVQTGLNAVLAAANATIPDQVPTESRGKVSGIVGLGTPIGILVGSILVNFLNDDFARFVVPGVIAVALSVLFVLVLKDRRLEHRPAQRFTVGQFFGSFYFNPRKHPDFGWTWLTKLFVMFGYAGVASFLPFYLIENFHLDEQAAIGAILLANVASTLAIVISAPLGGVISDRIGKRRPLVAAAGLIMVAGLVVLAFAPDVTTLIVAQGIIGLGAGCFFAVDLALATQVLPNPDDVAKDLGVLNIANNIPQSIAPLIAPAIIGFGASTALGGYTMWYLVGAVIALAGAILVYRVKGVK